jgi:peptide/nickel transport system substrate-binding protein
MLTDRPLHPLAPRYAEALRRGRMTRREYLASVMGLGVTGAAAAALGGFSLPGRAAAQEPRRGGTLRIAMEIKQPEDPRLWDWAEIGNIGRQACEHLVRWNTDFTFSPWLLSAWEANDDASRYTLKVRPGVTWADGSPFTAEDVAANIRRWCERDVARNSMAGRMSPLIDPDRRRMREGAVEVADEQTLILHLSQSDITIIPGMCDYPAAIVHPDFDAQGDIVAGLNLGTGPFRIEEWQPGVRAVATRREGYWGAAPWLDRVEWIDYGTDPTATVAALKAGEVDCNHQTLADTVSQLDALKLERSEVTTANTIVARFNVTNPPYDDPRVRRAAQLACDNEITLALGYDNRGEPAENHHVGPMHIEYFPLPPLKRDVARARALLQEAGQAGHEFELVSIDDDWRRATTDAIAAQLRDAGFRVRRKVIPGATFWNNWSTYPFSTTNWNARPLGVQVLALAYRSGEAWNETGFSDHDFDAALAAALATEEPEARRRLMEKVERILQDSGVIIQPYWRSIFRHHHPRVHGFPIHQALDQHLEEVWVEA